MSRPCGDAARNHVRGRPRPSLHAPSTREHSGNRPARDRGRSSGEINDTTSTPSGHLTALSNRLEVGMSSDGLPRERPEFGEFREQGPRDGGPNPWHTLQERMPHACHGGVITLDVMHATRYYIR